MERLIINELPPSVNHMYANRVIYYYDKQGKRRMKRIRVLNKEAQKWFDDTVITTSVWRTENKWETAKGKVIVRLWFYFKSNRHGDTHNGLKVLLDAFEDALIYENDKYALPRVMDYKIDKTNPRLEVEFEKVSE